MVKKIKQLQWPNFCEKLISLLVLEIKELIRHHRLGNSQIDTRGGGHLSVTSNDCFSKKLNILFPVFKIGNKIFLFSLLSKLENRLWTEKVMKRAGIEFAGTVVVSHYRIFSVLPS